MCVPGCLEKVHATLAENQTAQSPSRRSFLKKSSLLTAGALAMGCSATAKKELPVSEPKPKAPVDLTHALDADFPNFFGKPLFSMESNSTVKKDGFTTNRVSYLEHLGTHIDAPIHFSENGISVDKIPVEKLVAPLVVIDIRERAAQNADTTLRIEDIVDFEKKYGPIPPGACVAMNSGWAAYTSGKKFRNADGKGVMHFPGFSLEAAMMLVEDRDVVGIASDTLSLDPGNSKDFATHYYWLPSGRWGVECIANLDSLPAIGATVVVGAPKFVGGSGGPSRIIALL